VFTLTKKLFFSKMKAANLSKFCQITSSETTAKSSMLCISSKFIFAPRHLPDPVAYRSAHLKPGPDNAGPGRVKVFRHWFHRLSARSIPKIPFDHDPEEISWNDHIPAENTPGNGSLAPGNWKKG
jgi:hypothetical protein